MLKTPLLTMRPTTTVLPSGDQLGNDSGSELWVGRFRPLPFWWAIHTSLAVPVSSSQAKTRSLPEGDQSDCTQFESTPVVTSWSSVPLRLIVTISATSSRSVVNASRFPDGAGDGQQSNAGFNVVALDLRLDLSTPQGELVGNVIASVAQWERRIIGQRTKDALAVKKADGVQLGRRSGVPPSVVRRIRRQRASGRTLAWIAARLNADGVPTAQGGAAWHPATVRYVLGRAAA